MVNMIGDVSVRALCQCPRAPFSEFVVYTGKEAILMTSTPLEIRASFLDFAHTQNESDIDFYSRLPGVRFETVDPASGRPVVAAPGIGNTVRIIVVAILSSTALSTSIELWLKKEPTVIEITLEQGSDKKHLRFEGPNIKESRVEIEALINDLTKEGNSRVNVVAKRKPHPPAAPPGCESK
jgi:hypothetical protein